MNIQQIKKKEYKFIAPTAFVVAISTNIEITLNSRTNYIESNLNSTNNKEIN